MGSSAFVSADIEELINLEKRSESAIKEFDRIKAEYEEINSTLVKKWIGEGADSYLDDTSKIMEKIGGIKDVLDSLNNEAVKAIKDSYMKLDDTLGEFNRNPTIETEG
jgi:uncharacterized protein YukE